MAAAPVPDGGTGLPEAFDAPGDETTVIEVDQTLDYCDALLELEIEYTAGKTVPANELHRWIESLQVETVEQVVDDVFTGLDELLAPDSLFVLARVISENEMSVTKSTSRGQIA